MNAATIIAAVLTFMVWSYVLGDNPAFHIAEHLLVGSAVGFAVVVVWFNVLEPVYFQENRLQPELWSAIPLVLCLLLMTRLHPKWASLGSITVAFLVGVGAALAVGGALFGTLWSQTLATASLSLRGSEVDGAMLPVFSDTLFWQNLAVLIGTIGTFFYFMFETRPQGALGGFRDTFTRFWGGIGHWVIIITLGALFANAAMSRFTLLIGRVNWLLDVFAVNGRPTP
jgi:hypothetical protein